MGGSRVPWLKLQLRHMQGKSAQLVRRRVNSDMLTLALFGGAAILGLLLYFLIGRSKPWPVEFLKKSGDTKSSKLEDNEERRRDFTRIVASKGLLVVTANQSSPEAYPKSGSEGDVLVDEFSAWLRKQLDGHKVTDGLAERIVGCVNATIGFEFAMANRVPPMFPDAKYVLVIGSKGDVRVLWIAFAGSEGKPGAKQDYVLKVVTADLNSESVAKAALVDGVALKYAVESRRSTKDVTSFAKEHMVEALSRAAVEGNWDDALKVD